RQARGRRALGPWQARCMDADGRLRRRLPRPSHTGRRRAVDDRRRRRRPRRRAPARPALAVKLAKNVPLDRLTTLGTGGPARWFAEPASPDELAEVVAWAAGEGVAVEAIGLGS